MLLSEHGNIAKEQWNWLRRSIFPISIYYHLLVMPDHVHGIIYIDTDFFILK